MQVNDASDMETLAILSVINLGASPHCAIFFDAKEIMEFTNKGLSMRPIDIQLQYQMLQSNIDA